MSNQTKDKWADYVPDNADHAMVYAGAVFWFDDNGDIIAQERDTDTFYKWVEETGRKPQ